MYDSLGTQPVAQRCAGDTAAQSKSCRDELGSPEVVEANKETSVKHPKGNKQCSTKKVTWLTGQMSCLYTNTRSMGKKHEELEATVLLESYDLTVIIETWWDKCHDWRVASNGYRLFRRDKKQRNMFGQDRVNFRWNSGRGTAGRANPIWPNSAGYSIPCAIMLGSGGGEQGGGNSLTDQERAAAVRERAALFYELCSASLFCVFLLSVSLLLLFPLFAVLLNCPYPDPPVSACFFPSSSAPRLGEGRPRGDFVAGRSQTITPLHQGIYTV